MLKIRGLNEKRNKKFQILPYMDSTAGEVFMGIVGLIVCISFSYAGYYWITACIKCNKLMNKGEYSEDMPVIANLGKNYQPRTIVYEYDYLPE